MRSFTGVIIPFRQCKYPHFFMGFFCLKKFLCWCLLSLANASTSAVEIATPFSSNSVLQSGSPLPIWGTGIVGESVTVRFAGQELSTTVDARGRWLVTLGALAVNKEEGALQVIGSTSGTVVAEHILVGDVWLCSGQSNMEFKFRDAMNVKDELVSASQPMIRYLDVPNVDAAMPKSAIRGDWRVCSPGTVGGITAVGYFFARNIRKEVDIPIGLIEADWGGTRIEPWIPPAGFHSVPELSALSARVDSWDSTTAEGGKAWNSYIEQMKIWLPGAEKAVEKRELIFDPPQAPLPKEDHQEATRIYNGMIHPLSPIRLRGILWYQGESNGGEGVSYGQKLRALIQGWRKSLNDERLPFYFVQIANYQAPSDPEKPWVGDGWAPTRDAQFKALAIPHTGMAVTIDLGDAKDIHPKNKQDVGRRLAAWALAQEYGKNVVRSGPLFRSQAIEGASIRVNFEHVGGGLIVGEKHGLEPTVEVKDGKLTWFAIAGENKVWEKADARIDGDSVVVSAASISKPVAVRYAFVMNPQGCNLYNREGYPASPFRTDTW